ncbi:MAG: class II glutamine amidotransferase [Cyanobacteriota/Melainabacteria group bacterium]
MSSEILGMSFDSPASPSITLFGLEEGTREEGGWGFGWYPSDDLAGVVIKNPRTTRESVMRRVLRDWDRFRSSVFVCQLRGAAKRVSQQDTMPFLGRFAGRHWLFAHIGHLSKHIITELPLGEDPFYEPVGRSDSEYAFCWILTQLRLKGARTLNKAGWSYMHQLFKTINQYGPSDFLFSDGNILMAYRDSQGRGDALYASRRTPPHHVTVLHNDSLEIDFSDPLDQNRTMVLITSSPMSDGTWEEIPPGALMVAKLGKIIHRSHQPDTRAAQSQTHEMEKKVESVSASTPVNTPNFEQQMPLASQAGAQAMAELENTINPNSASFHVDGEFCQLKQQENIVAAATTSYASSPLIEPVLGGTSALVVEPVRSINAPPTIKPRILTVFHETSYEYTTPVEYSTHRLHLKPVQDHQQELLEYRLEISPEGETREFEDVFGNRSTDAKIDTPYKKLSIKAVSKVKLHPYPLLSSTSERMTVPLVWMPWQRQMMLPYLLPPELPESELRTLTEYAMGFVKREDFDLLEALMEINRTIFSDYTYVSGSTNLQTTPFEVFTKRKGVCQDFANLFICMARLLGIPARYRVGYINTGADYENKVQSEASHAWTELYLPWCGWYGFDPTNGCLVGHDHVRVAAGRNYRDASPTSGTIYKGGGSERLTVSVRVTVDEG